MTVGKQLAEEAIALDPEFSGRLHHSLCHLFSGCVAWVYAESPKESIDKAVDLAQKAISLDPQDSRPYAYLGFLSLLKKDYDKAIAEGERAVALDPGGADAHAWLGLILNYSDKPREAIPYA